MYINLGEGDERKERGDGAGDGARVSNFTKNPFYSGGRGGGRFS